MTGQELLALGARHERRDLGRHEPGQLGLLALDRLDQPGVLDGDGNLLGERRDEQDLGGRERPDFAAAEPDHPDDVAVLEDRHAEQGPDAVFRGRRPVVFGIGQDVIDVHGLAGQDDPAGHRLPADPVRVGPFEIDVGLPGLEAAAARR